MTNYPASIQSIPNPTSTDLLENATPELDHDYQHSTANDTIEALEAKVGVDGSAVTTSHDYKLGEVTGSDKAVGKTATQTLTNKTLTSPQINFGSDARGDLMYRNGSGVTARLPIGTSGQILSANSSGDPEWVANPAAADASTTVKGVVEIATTAQINSGTGTGETGAKLVMSPDTFAASDYVVNQVSPTDIQTFTSDGTWTKPTNAKSVLVQAWGGGGAGGFGDSGGTGTGGGGGGGGSYKEWTFKASDLSATESVVVGTGGTGGSGNGTSGGTSSFGTLLYAYGGGGGASSTGGNAGGGGGGGIASSGTDSTSTVGGNGGNIAGGTGGSGAVGTASSFGGGGGGGGANTGFNGGLSVHGGGGGGGGSNNTGAPSTSAGTGGLSFYGGGGGAGGPSQTGTVSGGTSVYGGAGGGSQYVGSGTATAGTNGGVRGGGGGGGTEGGNGGNGGRGEVVVTTYF